MDKSFFIYLFSRKDLFLSRTYSFSLNKKRNTFMLKEPVELLHTGLRDWDGVGHCLLVAHFPFRSLGSATSDAKTADYLIVVR